MRALVLVVIGLVLGAFGTHMLERTIHLRHAYPRAVMDVMQHHFVAMRLDVKRGTCPAQTTQGHVQSMLNITHEIGPAFDTDDTHFHDLANQLRASLKHVAKTAPTDCKTLTPMLKTIGQRCSACHREYR